MSEQNPRAGLLEVWSDNERMRHVPPAAWMVQKLDGDVRRRIDVLWLPYSDLPAGDPRHQAIEVAFRTLCRWLDRVSEVARRSRGAGHPPNDLGPRVQWSLSQAMASLNAAEAATFGRRLPFQTFERSSSEPLWAAMLSMIQQLQRITDLVREIEPEVDERVYEGLVQLAEPMRRDPIA